MSYDGYIDEFRIIKGVARYTDPKPKLELSLRLVAILIGLTIGTIINWRLFL